MKLNGIPVALGTASFGSDIAPKDAFGVMDAYVSLGGRILDTANSYAFWASGGRGGESESVIGSWLERQDRHTMTIMTKIGSQPADIDVDRGALEGLSPEAVHSAVDKSLARLKTDYIDILLAHHDHADTPLSDTWRAFSQLVEAVKVRSVGVSNYSPSRLKELADIVRRHSLAPVDFVQMKYSLIEPVSGTDLGMLRTLDGEMRDVLRDSLPDTVIFAYSPLLGGRAFAREADAGLPPEYDTAANHRIIADVQRQACELGVTPSACVLKRVADQGIIPITATGNAGRLRENLKLLAKRG